jgi:hypothetical protein
VRQVIIGGTGSVSLALAKHVDDTSGIHPVKKVQKTVLRGTAH